ncbi:hypothetical protein JCM16358_21650 [Halanaerocella petrolearia]
MKIIKAIILTAVVVSLIAMVTYLTLDIDRSPDKNQSSSLKSKVKEQDQQNQQLKNLVKKEQKKLSQQEPYINQQLSNSEKVEIDLDTEVIIKQINSLNKEVVVSQKKVNDSWTGLSKEELAKQLTKGRITEFNSGQVVIEVETEDIEELPKLETIIGNSSQDDSDSKRKLPNKLYLGIKDGYVAVYRGEILGEHELVEVRKDIPTKDLSKEDIRALQLGIEVEDREEMLSYLEGFASVKN